MFHLSEETKKTWAPVIESEDCAPIVDPYKKSVVTKLIENQAAMRQPMSAITEAAGDNNVSNGNVANWDPVLISLVRRAMPNTIGFDVAGVQPMSAPTQLIFALRNMYHKVDSGTLTKSEALHKTIDTTHSAKGGAAFEGQAGTATAFDGQNELNLDGNGDRQVADLTDPGDDVTLIDPYVTTDLESINGKHDATDNAIGFKQMGVTIDKLSVTAIGRALRADYTDEFAQDLKAVHGLDAENELASLLSTEMLNEINQEIILEINRKAKLRKDAATYAAAAYDLSTDADGRWAVERFKSLMFELELVANDIALDTRRGKGNWVICSSNVASALSAAGVLDSSPGTAGPLNVDINMSTFAGTIGGRMKVYVDPFAVSDYATVGYRGASPYDAGIFYCPYQPLELKRAVGEEDFQPRIGFKTRYAMSANPFVLIDDGTAKEGDTLSGRGKDRKNNFFRHFAITNINVA